jgi:hypothetical protein
MSVRERIDFTLIWAVFATLVAASTDFSILTSQIFVSPIPLFQCSDETQGMGSNRMGTMRARLACSARSSF